jgi:hypothetical protein
MDWFGVDGVIRAPWDVLQTLDEYALKPQYFNTLNFGSNITYIQYNESSPIVVSTNAPTVGMLNAEETGEVVYRAVFLTLAELNLNSQWLIPIKLERSDFEDNLGYVDTILVTSDQYQSYTNLFENYVNDGGNLVIMDYEPDDSEVKRAELVESNLIFYTYANPVTPHEDSEVIAKIAEGAVIYKDEVGAGSITYSSISVQELYEEASPVASAILGTIFIPNFNIIRVSSQSDLWDVSYENNALGVVSHLDNEEMLEYKVNTDGLYQINFRVILETKASTSATGLIQFELWNDGKTNDLAINLISSETSNYLSYTLSNSSWVGWRTFSVPLASFVKSSNVSVLEEFAGIDLVLTSERQSLEDSGCVLKVRSLGFFEAVSASTYQPLGYEWVRANELVASLGEGFGGGCLLWKESYVEHWGITADPVVSGVRFYYAGPGLMLLYIPDGVEEFTFTMPLTEIRIAGITISTITLLALPILSLYRKRSP